MKISEIITDKYKLRIPHIVYYDLLADVREAEEKQEPCEDAISRKAVLDAINTDFHEDLSQLEDAVKQLPPVNPQKPCKDCQYKEWLEGEDLPSVNPKQSWIPVSERLPEVEGRYLACIVNEHKRSLGYIMTCDWILDSISNNHWFPDDECASNNVVAWMPLPEPYKKEGGEKE